MVGVPLDLCISPGPKFLFLFPIGLETWIFYFDLTIFLPISGGGASLRQAQARPHLSTETEAWGPETGNCWVWSHFRARTFKGKLLYTCYESIYVVLNAHFQPLSPVRSPKIFSGNSPSRSPVTQRKRFYEMELLIFWFVSTRLEHSDELFTKKESFILKEHKGKLNEELSIRPHDDDFPVLKPPPPYSLAGENSLLYKHSFYYIYIRKVVRIRK